MQPKDHRQTITQLDDFLRVLRWEYIQWFKPVATEADESESNKSLMLFSQQP